MVVRWWKRPRNGECGLASAGDATESPAVVTAAPAAIASTAARGRRGTRMRMFLSLEYAGAAHAGVPKPGPGMLTGGLAGSAPAASPSTGARQPGFSPRGRKIARRD